MQTIISLYIKDANAIIKYPKIVKNILTPLFSLSWIQLEIKVNKGLNMSLIIKSSGEKKYITNYEGIDFAIGFENFETLVQYQEQTTGQIINYDIVLFDIDRAIAYKQFRITAEDRHYLVTSFDVYNIKRAVQVLAHIEKEAVVTKIYYTKNMLQEEDNYLTYLSSKLNIKWDQKNFVYFPFETDDLNAIYINQRTGRIQMKGLSKTYIDSILYLVEQISGESNGNVRKAVRKMNSAKTKAISDLEDMM